MKPEDFPQFTDPRVREVMAAAANLVETAARRGAVWESELVDLKAALFAAQHSRPKEDAPQLCDCKPGCTRVVQHNPKVFEEYMKRDRHYLGELRPMRPQKLPIQEPSPNPCGGDHGYSYECHACAAGRKV